MVAIFPPDVISRDLEISVNRALSNQYPENGLELGIQRLYAMSHPVVINADDNQEAIFLIGVRRLDEQLPPA